MESEINIDELLNIGIKKTNFKPEGEVKYGWNKKSAGVKAIDNSNIYWLRVQYRKKEYKLDKLWYGEIDSANFSQIKKPILINYLEWHTDTLTCRLDILEYIPFAVCSSTPHLQNDIQLSATWLKDLKSSLENLQEIQTERIAVRQDLISRRIQERFGDRFSPSISEWVTIHGDIHWANLTKPECWILDWESWGLGPKGFDAAFLYCFSLLKPVFAEKIYETFRDDLDTKDGIISQIFACAELLRMIELYYDYPILKEPLEKHASFLIKRVIQP